jgi:1-phosphatidylinositol-3-phosphate 5-kinase
VLNALHQISEKRPITGSFDGNIKILELRRNIVELEDILQAEKADFTVNLFYLLIFKKPLSYLSSVKKEIHLK